MQQHLIHAVLAAYNAQSTDRTAYMQVVDTQRRNMAAILASPVRVFRVTRELLERLQVESTASVALFARSAYKLYEKRARDAIELLASLPGALTNPVYRGSRKGTQGARTQFELVFRRPDRREIFVGIKFVPASRSATKQDECWVETMYFLRVEERERLLESGRLFPCIGSDRDYGDLRL